MTTLNTQFRAGFGAELVSAKDNGAARFPLQLPGATTIPTGTANGQADTLFDDDRSLAAGASESLDLAGGVLTGPLGDALTFADIVGIYIRADATNQGNLLVGGAAANAFSAMFGDATDKIILPPGAEFMITNPTSGYVVTPGTGDLLKIENADGVNAAGYRITLIGRSV